jgi:diaminohydroxyphosphoribosylaminopyrimidine deaminase/5-amino-6-(5-phosphoribosylamino)uracil reductase
MRLALALGRRGLGRVWPNPSVGCVIVADGRIVGRGRTADGGRPHAETIALSEAGELASGATAYVTLEPCAHHGKTPPCAEALVDAGVARVVIAAGDPNPVVSGRGIETLRSAGIAVQQGVLEEEARNDLRGFLSVQEQQRPFVTLKLALTIDGRIATSTGDSQWITGTEARRRVHMMRSSHDAVLVGGGTARADDPMLTVRGLGIERQPVRVVMSNRLDLSCDSNLGRSARDVPVWLCHGPDASAGAITNWRGVGAETVLCEATGDKLDVNDVLRKLAERGLTRVFCEGGGEVASSLISAGLIDELLVFQAGCVIGGDGRSGIGAMGLTRLADAPRMKLVAVERIGEDVLGRWTV